MTEESERFTDLLFDIDYDVGKARKAVDTAYGRLQDLEELFKQLEDTGGQEEIHRAVREAKAWLVIAWDTLESISKRCWEYFRGEGEKRWRGLEG